MHTLACLLVALALPIPLPAPTGTLAPLATGDDVTGAWFGEVIAAGQIENERVLLELSRDGEGALVAVVRQHGVRETLQADYDASSGALHVRGPFDGYPLELRATREGERFTGRLMLGAAGSALELRRGTPADVPEPLVVDFTVERPSTVALDGLAPEVAAQVVQAIEALMDAEQVVGLSAAFVVDGELVDERHFGWQDFHGRVPVGAETSYRWASISKPLTAVVALQLAEEGALALERDVRGYVPEWPDKGHAITSLQLLAHLGGVPHYAGLVPRSPRATELEHPWADRVFALHMFDESPLVGVPGASFHYTTPGYVLLGAVIERAGKKPFDALVLERVAEPCGMASLQPDYPWVEIPHRTRGYHRDGEGRVLDSGDDEVSWKLPAGGWTSTVGDLARFAIGVTGDDLLDGDARERMWTRAQPADGTPSSYSLGWEIGRLGDERLVSHSGGQLKTSTFLLVAPEAHAAVAMMCNTQRTDLEPVARACLARMLGLEQ